MTFDKTTLQEKVTIINIRTALRLEDSNVDFLFDYNIFPSHIMTFLTQWSSEKRSMKVGDTILQQVFFPPVKNFSQKMIFGVRINDVIDDAKRKGFSYVTLEGHVEKGESIFTLEEAEAGLIFKIRTFSKPGNLLTTLVDTFLTSPYQAYCTRAALANIKRQLEQI
ncbi:hypothetical protein DQQ10_10795 [Pseudochryseolinea flava]|uniref:DUF1990 domain-containing protein n=2 Tax=Pseudochryseolinea flava TaxID=2059302 RepID=A0A364Y3J4_9BACT|nr:hypothetical protein DQQ10_10795 [Pseudochryseolinea flava]